MFEEVGYNTKDAKPADPEFLLGQTGSAKEQYKTDAHKDKDGTIQDVSSKKDFNTIYQMTQVFSCGKSAK